MGRSSSAGQAGKSNQVKWPSHAEIAAEHGAGNRS